MATFDIFSKRDKKGKEPDVYIYDEIPAKLRVQIYHLIKDTIGSDKSVHTKDVEEIYTFIRKVLIKEYGVFSLDDCDGPELDVLHFLLNTQEVEKALDVIELCFRVINTHIRENEDYGVRVRVGMKPNDAIIELNERFKENAVGYIFEVNRLIRVDSTYAHSKITKPTLKILSNPIFKNANEEYLKAHEHYRHGRNKECLVECLKAFESVMKIICKAKRWEYSESDTAIRLIKTCLENGLVPSYLQNQFTSLKTVLESGIPTIRNKVGGHGQGSEKNDAEDHLVRYALNVTGSNIIFLAEQSELV